MSLGDRIVVMNEGMIAQRHTDRALPHARKPVRRAIHRQSRNEHPSPPAAGRRGGLFGVRPEQARAAKRESPDSIAIRDRRQGDKSGNDGVPSSSSIFVFRPISFRRAGRGNRRVLRRGLAFLLRTARATLLRVVFSKNAARAFSEDDGLAILSPGKDGARSAPDAIEGAKPVSAKIAFRQAHCRIRVTATH